MGPGRGLEAPEEGTRLVASCHVCVCVCVTSIDCRITWVISQSTTTRRYEPRSLTRATNPIPCPNPVVQVAMALLS